MRAAAVTALALLLAAPATAQSLSSKGVDAGIGSVLAERGVKPSPAADDATFLRRVTLDVTGAIPQAEDVERFLADRSRGKRTRVIQRLLASPDYAKHLAEEMTGVLLERLQGEAGGAVYYRDAFRGYLQEAFASDRPYDALVAELLAGEGQTDGEPELIYLLDRGTEGAADVAGSATRQFMGLQLECARCHDHPFDDTTQARFHGLAAYFSRLRVRQVPGRNGSFTVREAPLGEHRFTFVDGKRREVPPTFLGAGKIEPGVTPAGTTKNSRRVTFVRWLTSPENPWFARAIVNRVWARLLGRGLVEPVDDLSAAADSPHAAFLEALARGFVRSGHSLKKLHAAILGSQTYQRSATARDEVDGLRDVFATARVRPLRAGAVADSLLQAAGRLRPAEGESYAMHRTLRARITASVQRALPEPRVGEPPDANRVTTAEGVFFLNGRAPNGLVRGPVLTRLLAGDPVPASRVRTLYLRTLSRPPTQSEQRVALAFLKRRHGLRAAYEDLFWALIASSEFGSNH